MASADLITGVERLTFEFDASQTSITLGHSLDRTKITPFMTWRMQGTSGDWKDLQFDVEISSSTDEVTVSRIAGGGLGGVAEVYLVEWDTSLVNIISGSFQITATNPSTVESPGGVAVDSTFVWGYYKHDTGNDDWDNTLVNIWLISSVSVGFLREGLAGQIDGHWWGIECLSGEFSVEHIQMTLLGGTDSIEETLSSSVDMSKTLVIGTSTSTEIGDDPRDAAVTLELKDADTIRAERELLVTSSPRESSIQAQVIEFEGPRVNVQRGSSTSLDTLIDVTTLDPFDENFAIPFPGIWRPTCRGTGNQSNDPDDVFQTFVLTGGDLEIRRELALTPGENTTTHWQVAEIAQQSQAASPEVASSTATALDSFPHRPTEVSASTARALGQAGAATGGTSETHGLEDSIATALEATAAPTGTVLKTHGVATSTGTAIGTERSNPSEVATSVATALDPTGAGTGGTSQATEVASATTTAIDADGANSDDAQIVTHEPATSVATALDATALAEDTQVAPEVASSTAAALDATAVGTGSALHGHGVASSTATATAFQVAEGTGTTSETHGVAASTATALGGAGAPTGSSEKTHEVASSTATALGTERSNPSGVATSIATALDSFPHRPTQVAVSVATALGSLGQLEGQDTEVAASTATALEATAAPVGTAEISHEVATSIADALDSFPHRPTEVAVSVATALDVQSTAIPEVATSTATALEATGAPTGGVSMTHGVATSATTALDQSAAVSGDADRTHGVASSVGTALSQAAIGTGGVSRVHQRPISHGSAISQAAAGSGATAQAAEVASSSAVGVTVPGSGSGTLSRTHGVSTSTATAIPADVGGLIFRFVQVASSSAVALGSSGAYSGTGEVIVPVRSSPSIVTTRSSSPTIRTTQAVTASTVKR